MKKRSQSVNVKHRKISFGDFQTETIGISVKKILIEVPLIVWLALGLGVDDAVRERRKIGKNIWLAFELGVDDAVHKRRKIGKKHVVGVRSGCYSPQKTQNRQKNIWLAFELGVDDAVRKRRKIGKKYLVGVRTGCG